LGGTVITSYREKTILQPARLSIRISADNPDFEAAAKGLAAQLGLGFCPDSTTVRDGLLLVLSEGGLRLEAPGGQMKPLKVDFTAKALLWRLSKGGGLQQPVARAVGLKSGWRPTVLDATAGLGMDAFILASLGCTVEMVERSPTGRAWTKESPRLPNASACGPVSTASPCCGIKNAPPSMSFSSTQCTRTPAGPPCPKKNYSFFAGQWATI